MTVTVEQFAADPLAPVSPQLALDGSTFTSGPSNSAVAGSCW
jgi:hypothetical protein